MWRCRIPSLHDLKLVCASIRLKGAREQILDSASSWAVRVSILFIEKLEKLGSYTDDR